MVAGSSLVIEAKGGAAYGGTPGQGVFVSFMTFAKID